MCGVCGFAPVDPREAVDRALIERMTATLVHRGPDGCGVLAVPGAGLGVRRLAVVDLETGDQPIANEDGSVAVACNGEIYNGPELRSELEGAGHRLRTRSDVEPVVHLYEEHGLDFVKRLRGMFALALWDGRERRLVLARDRFGIKPMVYAETAAGLWFGSEAKAILAGGAVGPSADARAIHDLLAFGFVRTPRTMFAGIRRLPPAHVLVWEAGEARLRRYWRPPDVAERSALSEREWAEALLAKLDETVRVHLRSDVEVGGYLSPGLDSSAVVALASRALGRPLRTFTLAFSDPACDETRGARTLDAFPGHEMPNERVLCDESSFGLLPDAVRHLEEPTAFAIEVPETILARAASRRVKVVVTGEGSDELFGGYRHLRTNRWTAALARIPFPLRRAALGGRLEASHPWLVPLLLAPRAMGPERYRALVGVTPAVWAENALSDDLRRELAARPGDDAWPLDAERAASLSPFAALRLCDAQVRLPDYILHTADRCAMACGLEVRVPFLDHELAELCAGIPPSLLLRWRTEKSVLRRALAPVLPGEVVRRRKRGLLAPYAGWWRRPLPAFVEEMLATDRLRASGQFDAGVVRELLREPNARARASRVLNAVLGVQLWHEIFVRGRTVSGTA